MVRDFTKGVGQRSAMIHFCDLFLNQIFSFCNIVAVKKSEEKSRKEKTKKPGQNIRAIDFFTSQSCRQTGTSEIVSPEENHIPLLSANDH